ncbi:hypothetical protein [Streptomyces sp. FH025]|uniref:hypothetical protein n=1 Tax=Streptomyces sp. FH025 TaxID=2815937 RepID=UPI001A9F1EDB|nr:hypothetical protein [Streptomyces sp. FH025]MBO1413548.1 hypothetical protein [Streptomyces sp. FH025]
MTLSEAELLTADEDRLEELFRTSPPGEIPEGPMEGAAIIGAGTGLTGAIAALVRLAVWRGKVFDRAGGYLSNRLSPLDVLAVLATVAPGPSRLDGEECIVIDYSRTSLVARGVRDEIRQVGPDLYLGVIWLFGAKVGWFSLRKPRTGGDEQQATNTQPTR